MKYPPGKRLFAFLRSFRGQVWRQELGEVFVRKVRDAGKHISEPGEGQEVG